MSINNSNNEFVQYLELENSKNFDLTFVLEPWGHYLIIPPGVTYLLIFRGSNLGPIQIRLKEAFSNIYAWSDAKVSVFEGENEILSL